jgi:flagellar protein FliO/FliZ
MDYLFNVEMPTAVKLIVAFAIVLLLLAAVMWVFKRFGGNRLGTPTPRGRQPRLAVIDAAAVDGRRRLVLIRRDNVEHLIMIGGPTDVLIEQNIMRAVPVAPPREVPPPPPPQRMPVEPPVRAHAEPLVPRPPRAEPPPRSSRGELPPRRPIDDRYRAETPRTSSLDTPRPMRAAPAPRAEFDSAVDVHPAPPTADPSLADMAHKLEAALRRPPAPRRPESAPVAPPPALNEPTPPTAPEVNGNGARSAPAAPPPAASVEAPSAPKPAAADPKPPSKSLFDSLEEEMASLLNKPPEKGAPEKK